MVTLQHIVLGLCHQAVEVGKGSKPRPFSVSQQEFANSFETIFGKKDKMQVRVKENLDEIGRCGCGRSPTGYCIGWHGLSEEEFQKKLLEHQEKNK